MANHKSAAKRARQSLKRQAVNNKSKSSVKTHEKNLASAISAKDSAKSKELLNVFMSKMDKAAQKGVVTAKHASRKIASLSRQVWALTK